MAEIAAHGGETHHAALQHHFTSLEQQREASTLGMWVFIAQEILFFGGLFAAYTVYRTLYPDAFSAGSHHLSWKIGFFNTLVLIGSSLTMAMGVYSAAIGKKNRVVGFILATILLGSVFLGVKYFEMTGLHALHMVIGLGIMSVIAFMAWRKTFDAEYYTPVEVAGLYWHFVDIVWIFLFPLLYLIGHH